MSANPNNFAPDDEPISARESARRLEAAGINSNKSARAYLKKYAKEEKLFEEQRKEEFRAKGLRYPFSGRSWTAARNGDKKQARARINYLVLAKCIPAPNELPCSDCGHIWTSVHRRHEYDHYLGYAAEHHEDVQSVCTICHAKRPKL